MTRSYEEQLLFTRATDDVPLEGALISPAGHRSKDLGVVWIHGGASKFYEPHYVAIGREMARRGYSFLTGNTRGHDGFTLLWRGDQPTPSGGSFERFDESPRDLSAWLDVASASGLQGVVLAGHSMGAAKVVYYQALKQDSRVHGLVAVSPPIPWPPLPDRISLAKGMVEEGRGQELLPHLEGTPPWNIVSAQLVLTREEVARHAFDSDSQTPWVAQIQCPLLVLYGGAEGVEPNWLETIRANAAPAGPIDMRIVEGADHEYGGHEKAVAEVLAEWINTLDRMHDQA